MLSGKKAYKMQSELKLRKAAHTSNFQFLEMSRKKAYFPTEADIEEHSRGMQNSLGSYGKLN